MSSQNSSNIEPDQNKISSVDIQEELNRLEEMVLSSPHIPLTRRTLVDEEQLLDQVDLLRLNLPAALQEAQAIVEQQQEIILNAQQHAEIIIQAAEAKAAQILNETAIVRQAELAAKQIQQQMQQEYIAAQEQNLFEIDQMRQQAEQELEQMRQKAIAESQEIQQGADDYADAVLNNLQQQLEEMLRVIYNGRQQLNSSASKSNKSSIASNN
jgi:cell division septum initiation protein DivIVA